MKKLILFLVLLRIVIMSSALTALSADDGFDITTANIGVMTGSTGESYAVEHYPNAEIESYNDYMDAVAALSANKLTAVIMFDATAMNVVNENPSMIMDEERLVEETISIVVDKGQTELLNQFNDVLRQLEEDGTLADMEQRWMKSAVQEAVDIPLSDGPVLKVATTATKNPFSIKDEDGNITGFSAELALRAGQIMNRQIEFVIVDFSALISALKSGKADAIIDLLVYTEERAKSVEFSDVYYTGGQVVLRNNPDGSESSWFSNIGEELRRNLIDENRWEMLRDGFGVTMLVSFCAFILATLLGFLLCAVNMSRSRILCAISKVYLYLIRGIPMVVLLFLLYYVIFAKSDIDPVLVAILAFGMNSAAAMCVIFRTALETVDKGQHEAAKAIGFGEIGMFFNITFPQAVQVAFPTYKSEFISLFKGTAIIGYIAIVDLTKAGDFIRSQTFNPYIPTLTVAFVYLLSITLFIWLFEAIFRIFDKRGRNHAKNKRLEKKL